jgi:non-homologous end joining protein Ku
MVTPFEHAHYKSEYKTALDRLVKAKLRHKELPAAAAPERKVIDLQEALRRSLQEARPRGARRRPRRMKAAS